MTHRSARGRARRQQYPSGAAPSVLPVKVMVALYAIVLAVGFAYFTVVAFIGN